jgi:hypothetical protein
MKGLNSIRAESQSPKPKIEVFTPKGFEDQVFKPESGAGAWGNLQSYTFTESTEDIEGSFSFTTLNDIDTESEKSIFELIPLRSIMKIYEGGDHPSFVGIIRRIKFEKQMTSQGIKQSIIFSGKSLISCVSEYMVSLDVRIYNVANAADKNKELTVELAGKTSMEEFIKTTWEYFKKVSHDLNQNLNGVTNTKIAEIISEYLGDIDTFLRVTGAEQTLQYHIANAFFNAQNNHIVDVWRNILPKDVYEIFSFCDREGKAKIMVRMVPFGDPGKSENDWGNLDIYTIRPISLIGYALDQNDENVYTAFASYIIGSAMSRNFYMAINQEGPDDMAKYNAEKVAIYGFRPLEISFMGYDRQGNTDGNESNSASDTIRKLNGLAEYWYSRNDDMYSGTITVITDFKQPKNNPKVGCRAKFLGGEFYINRTEHTWTFGGTPTIKLSVSRGMMYDEKGIMRDGEDGIIKGIGNKYAELKYDKGQDEWL